MTSPEPASSEGLGRRHRWQPAEAPAAGKALSALLSPSQADTDAAPDPIMEGPATAPDRPLPTQDDADALAQRVRALRLAKAQLATWACLATLACAAGAACLWLALR